jgi:pSer/pThr/pTyr-binding forkhead associated (FHA) protein
VNRLSFFDKAQLWWRYRHEQRAKTQQLADTLRLRCEYCQVDNPADMPTCLVCGYKLAMAARLMCPNMPPVVLGAVTLIGRSWECHVRLTEDKHVSRHHARIEQEGNDYILTNLSHKNFTRLNDAYVRQPTILKDSDQIRVGRTVLMVNIPAVLKEALAHLIGSDQQPFALYEKCIVGRGEGDLLVDDESVSWRHAEISQVGKQFVLVDLSSTNGTFVNKLRVTQPIVLNNQDEIKVGNISFVLKSKTAPAPSLEGILSRPSIQPYAIKAYTTIGREASCDYILESISVSRRHAAIERQGSGFVLSDLGSENGTFVNDQRVVHPIFLKSGDQIRFGDVSVAFSLRLQTIESGCIPGSPDLWTNPHFKRYGRVEYFSPMDLNYTYQLSVGLLIERISQQVKVGAQVRWTTIILAPSELNPTLRIRVTAPHCRIAPSWQDIVVPALEDAVTTFSITPISLPPTTNSQCDIYIDFEYQGQVVRRISLITHIQQQFGVGPLRVPHDYWRYFAGLAFCITLIDGVAGAAKIIWNPEGDSTLLVLGLFVALVFLSACPLLWRKATQRLSQGI